MKSLALVIGNSAYPKNDLVNPINDAEDFGNVLKRLGFTVRRNTNVSIVDFDKLISSFGEDLNNYDVGVFYFAGHGLQIDEENFLTAIDTSFQDEGSAKYTSIPLNRILSYMHSANNNTNIIILDACRDNPFEKKWHRSIRHRGLAPVYAPKGTLIAFATSSGETASDGIGRNGLFTSALLKHIEDENIQIEELFKRVRNSVFALSNGKQTTWEHTSLTGNYIFNSGQINFSPETPYSEKVVVDKKFEVSDDDDIDRIIIGLKSHDWYRQNPAVNRIYLLDPNQDKDKLFVMGRNILQAACGSSNSAIDFIFNIERAVDKFNINNENHVLNGILFEIYFNSEGKFREENFKNCYFENVFKLRKIKKYTPSFEFINNQLIPYQSSLFFTPTSSASTVSLDLVLAEQKNERGMIEYAVKSIKHQGVEVLKKRNERFFWGDENDIYYEPLLYSKFIQKLSDDLVIPSDLLTINSSYTLDENSKILFPYGFKIEK
jgi:hypothetical protein